LKGSSWVKKAVLSADEKMIIWLDGNEIKMSRIMFENIIS